MKKIIRRIISVCAVVVLFFGAGALINYLIVDDTTSYTRVAFHEMYESEKNIDVLFLGTSHAYRSFNPVILDRELGMNTFNGGTSYQPMDSSYMILREAAKGNDLKKVYLEMYFEMTDDVYKERTQMTKNYIVSDYIRFSPAKVKFLLDASGEEHYFNSFIKARRNWNKLLDFQYIKELVTKKNTEAYKNYQYDYITYSREWYEGKGYVATDKVIKNWNFFSKLGYGSIKLENISDDYLRSLNSIVDFCAKNDIELTLVSAPMPQYLTSAVGNYDEYIAYMKAYAESKGIEYWDFNLCREEYFPVQSEFYKDDDHLNNVGADLFSQLFSDLVNGKVTTSELFHNSYAEKMAATEPTVFGITYRNKGSIKKCRIVSSSEEIQYQIVMAPKDGEEYILRDYSSDTKFEIDRSFKGKCIINAIVNGEVVSNRISVK